MGFHVIWSSGYNIFFILNSTERVICPANIDCLCWGLMTCQHLWVILCRLPEKGRKETERVEEIKERDREERNRNESEETEEIKTFPLYPYLL